MISLAGTVLFGILFLLFYIWKKRVYSYWERLGVPQLHPIPLIGDTLELLTLKTSLGKFYEDLYLKHKDKRVLGLYELVHPTLLIIDPHLIENILVKDFSYFVNRDLPDINKHKSIVDSGLPQLKNSEWRGLRYKMIPAFSTGKLKLMFPFLKNCAKAMLENIEAQPKNKVEIQEVTTMYALDVIGTCAFGIDIRQDINKNSQFRNMGRKIFNLNNFEYYCFLLLNLSVRLAEKLGLTFTSGEVGKFFGQMIKETIKVREDTKTKRNDFIDLIIQLKDKGTIEVQQKDVEDSYLKMDYEPVLETFEITETMLVSSAFTFLTAGFDGLWGPMACILYELAKQPELQDRARKELQEQIAKYGDLSYDALKHSKYLDCCINEGLRLYPLTQMLSRVCNKEYEILPGVKIQPGTKVIICNGGSQLNPEYYPDPYLFDPSRFEDKIALTVSDFNYLPFGAGPRMCIGMRMALLIMKMGLASILSNYYVNPTPRTPKKLTMKIKTFFINQPADPMEFSLKKVN